MLLKKHEKYQNTSENDVILGKNSDAFKSMKNLETSELYLLLIN